MAMKFSLLALAVVTLQLLTASIARAGEEIDQEIARAQFTHAKEWSLWKEVHGKSYDSELEELERHVVWMANKKYIEVHNANEHIFGFTLAMNHYGDMTDAEYAEKHNTYSPVSEELKAKMETFAVAQSYNLTGYPDSLDWRTKGAVGTVKNQLPNQCGSAYAFSAIGALEGAWALATGKLVSLSEQNIVDCSVPYGNYGCSGGNMYNSFMYVIANNGVNTAQSYSYMGRQSQCSYNSKNDKVTMSGVINVKCGDETSLLAAVAGVGPISVAVDASSKAFMFYYGGVFDSSQCSSSSPTHAMIVTGYGTYNGKKYWLLKNSWGEYWGLSGYIMMSRDKYNQCGIATDASYPTL